MPQRQPPPNDLPLYLGLLFALGLVLTCLTGLLGTGMVYLIAVGGAVALIALLHYVLWGHWMKGTNRDEGE